MASGNRQMRAKYEKSKTQKAAWVHAVMLREVERSATALLVEAYSNTTVKNTGKPDPRACPIIATHW